MWPLEERPGLCGPLRPPVPGLSLQLWFVQEANRNQRKGLSSGLGALSLRPPWMEKSVWASGGGSSPFLLVSEEMIQSLEGPFLGIDSLPTEL